MWTCCLDNVEIDRLVQERFDNQIAPFRVMEEYENTPVDQPGALCQQLHATEAAVVDKLPQTIQVFQSRRPVESEDLSGELSPQNIQVVLIIRLHNHQANVQI